MICPHCGHTYTRSRQIVSLAEPPADVASMSETAMRAHYKRTAPYYDVRFYLDHTSGLTPELTQQAASVAMLVDSTGRFNGCTRAEFYVRLAKLKYDVATAERWRKARTTPAAAEARFWKLNKFMRLIDQLAERRRYDHSKYDKSGAWAILGSLYLDPARLPADVSSDDTIDRRVAA